MTENELPVEQILFRTYLHWKIYVPAWLLLLLCGAVIAAGIAYGLDPALMLLVLVVPFVAWVVAYVRRRFSEFCVTDRRVLIKTGVLSRRTLETLLTKVENIGVEQTVWGRLFNYGTIYVTG